MKSPTRFAFFLAMPIEAANMYFRDSWGDLGISVGGVTLEKLMSCAFNVIHWPGLYASDWFDYVGYPKLGLLAIVASGYLDTVLLLVACLLLFRWLRPRGPQHPAAPDGPTED